MGAKTATFAVAGGGGLAPMVQLPEGVFSVFSAGPRQTALDRLTDPGEIALVRKLTEYPRLIEAAASAREPHRVAFYLYDVASALHAHWNRGTSDDALRFVKVNDRQLTQARLGLVQGVLNVLQSGLAILGVDAPTEMR